jgi:pilus assembly protein Flp/PilA
MVAIQMYFTHAMESLRRFRDNEDGQGLAEYSLILALIAILAIPSLEALGVQINAVLDAITAALEVV